MTQIILDIDNHSSLEAIKNFIKNLKGVRINKTSKVDMTKESSGWELAMADIEAGRINKYNSIEEMLTSIKNEED